MKNQSLRYEIEVIKFYLAIYGFKRKGGSKKTLDLGLNQLKRHVEHRNNALDKIIWPLTEDVPTFKTLPNILKRSLRGSAASEEQALNLGEIFYGVCLYFSSRSTKVKEVLEDSKDRGYFYEAMQSCSQEGVLLNLLMNSSFKDKKFNKWITKATLEVKETTNIEVKVNQLKEVENISESVRIIESRISSPETTEQERISLIKEKEKRMETLEKVTEELGQDSPAALAIVKSILDKASKHLTKTGEKQTLSTEQEDVMVSKGKIEVSAGAGSGKTKLVASKVEYTIKELNVPSEKLMVVSSTKDSSENLRDKVISYTGEKATGRLIGVTPESVAFKILEEAGSLRDKNLILEEDLDDWMLSAIEQVKQGEGSEATPSTPLLRKASLSEDHRLKPLLVKVAKVMAEKAYLTDSVSLMSMVSPAIKKISNGQIIMQDENNSIWEDTNFRSSISDYISTSQGSKTLKSAMPYEGFKRFASSGIKPPSSTKNRNEWFNIGFDVMSNISKPNLNELKNYISSQKKAMRSPSDLWSSRKTSPATSLKELRERVEEDLKIAAYGAYEHLKSEQSAIDPQDYSVMASQSLIDDSKLLNKINEQYSHIFIDEAQDLSKAEKVMFDLVAGSIDAKTLSPKQTSAESYMLIGDTNQSGTKVANEDRKAVLTTNFRSRLNIVEAANNIISSTQSMCSPDPMKDGGDIYYKIYPKDMSPGKSEVCLEIKQKVDFEGWNHDGENHKFGIACRSMKEVFGYALKLMINKVSCSTKFDILDTNAVNAVLAIVGIRSNNPLIQFKSICDIHKYLEFELPKDFNDYLSPEGESVLDALLNESYIFSKNPEVKRYVEALTEILSLEDDLETILDFAIYKLKDSKDQSLCKKYMTLITQEEKELLVKESLGEPLSAIEAYDYIKSGFDSVVELFKEKDWRLEDGLQYIESMKKVSKMSSKERGLDRVLVRTVQEWKGLECRDIYVSMSPSRFPRMGISVKEEEKLGYLAFTRGQEKVKVLCSEDTTYIIEKACILSEEDFLAKKSPEKSASFVDNMTLWLKENQ